jgi:hypothetical protein
MSTLRKIINWICHGIWTDCRHESRRCGRYYFSVCTDCGAEIDDYQYEKKAP